ncbi:MAG TPA: hypothetical protein VF109_03745 [Mycobacteriales bacterium]
MRVALGFTPHSGWAAAVAVAGGPADPVVLDRRRLLLTDRELPCQPYHEAAGLDPAVAAELVAEAYLTAAAQAERGVGRLAGDLAAAGHEATAAAVVAATGSVREDLPLPAVLAAHARLHAAEGELFRDVLLDAATARGLAVSLLSPRQVAAAGRGLLGPDRLTALGRPLGPPWTRDHKDAVVAALLAGA